MQGTTLPYSGLSMAASAAIFAPTTNSRVRSLGATETAGAAARVIFHHGASAAGPAFLSYSLAPKQTHVEPLPDVDCSDGIYAEVVSGTLDAFAHVRSGHPAEF